MTKNNTSISIYFKIYILLVLLYIFFSTVNFYLNFFLLVCMLLLNILTMKSLKILKKDYFVILFLLFLICCFISLFSPYNVDMKNGIIFILCSIIFLLVYVRLTHLNEDWVTPFLKYLGFFLMIFAIGTLLQVFVPNFIDSIKKIYVQKDKIELSRNFITNQSLYSGYNGLVVQTGTNAFLMCIFIGYCLYNLLLGKDNKKYIFLTAFGFILLLLTNKRTLLFSGAFSFLFVFLLYKRFNLKYIISVFVLSFIFVFVIFNYTSIGNRIVNKMNMGEDSILSGRDILYNKMYNNFKKSPIIGVGIDSKVDGRDGHNIYLQVASETGVLGILILLIFLLRNLRITWVCLSKSNDHRELFALSLYVQMIFLIWGLTGNPLYDQFTLLTYFVFAALTNKCINVASIKKKYKGSVV